MKHVELYCHYLRQLVQEKVITLVYCRINDQITDIFMKSLSEEKFIKLCTLLGIQEDAIIGGGGGCVEVIPPPESPECYANGGY